MGVAALFRGAHVPVDEAVLLLHRAAQGVVDPDAVGAHHRHFPVLHVGDLPGVLDDGGDVRCDEAAALAVAQQQRRVLAHGDEGVGQVGAEDAQGIGALDAVQHAVDRLHDVAGLPIVVGQQLRHHLRICLGAEGDALADQIFLDLHIVFDDAVVHHRDAAVLAEVGVGVHVVGLPVGGPAGVPDADTAFHRLAAVHQSAEDLQPPLGLFHLQALLV